jgi:hypothetical protein
LMDAAIRHPWAADLIRRLAYRRAAWPTQDAQLGGVGACGDGR